MKFSNDVGSGSVQLMVVAADGVENDVYPDGLTEALERIVEERKIPLTVEEDNARKAARDMLRNGRYKPTGRGKPAS